MEKNISKIKQRILKYIDYQGISKRSFYIKTGISNGVLDKPTGLTEDSIEKYISSYPEVSVEWLITGKGGMLKPSYENIKRVSESEPEYLTMRTDNSKLLEIIDVQNKAIKSLERNVELLEEKLAAIESRK